jgi:hypothetical protein
MRRVVCRWYGEASVRHGGVVDAAGDEDVLDANGGVVELCR